MPNLTAIQERFDAIAAEALEHLIEDVERKDRVKVTGLEVVLVPQASIAGSPAVEVNLTVETMKRPTL
jgi:DNA-binding LacI/PurR family transcriptional regulator